jgi:hypothetical protein
MKRGTVCRLLVPLLLIAVSVAGSAATQAASIHQRIQQTYNFQPHLLSHQQINEKSAALDQFWTTAKSEPSVYIPALRQELGDFKSPPLFLYDGSALLLSLSDTATDRKIALAAMARCDLRDVQPKDYFLQVHRMAALNENTTAAAFHVLEQPKFKVFIPEHFMWLGQDYVLIYMLLPADQDYWLQPAIERLQTEHDQTAQKSLLLLLWYAQTDAADQSISAFTGDASKPQASRTYAGELMHRKDKIGSKQKTEAAGSPEALLRQKRRERLKAVNDEALIDLDDYTLMLAAKRQ